MSKDQSTIRNRKSEITILIADDQRLLREGLATLLALTNDIRIVAQASNGNEAISLANQHQPDVILMDIQMPGADGVAATQAIHSAQPQTQIIMLTTFADDDYLFAALRAGACGYLLKDIPSEQLADAVRAAHRGESPITPTMARKLVNRVNQQPRALAASPLIEPLSDREIEVLNLIAHGLSNKEIAERLVIAEGTAKNHVSNILGKLDAKDRAQAVMRGKELGLL
ncbi:MAG: response regulator transcription factor [Chloroflexota bacterium]